ncbi:metal-dependent hydrolase [Aliiroseovarius sp.]|uniref:metal-dependent hydrolase n=1 Tax=Aliiroseovarius sp. TaxID=1872442 RepID=UPI003BAD0AFE
MITAHLPSGYLLGRGIRARGWLMGAAVLGAVFPDFDLIWFYGVDGRAFHHHLYWVHMPAFWLVTGAALLTVLRLAAPGALPFAAAFLAGVALHLVLDTFAGGIAWAWPVSNHLTTLVAVPATQSHWLLSFILHWSFLPELAIWAAALFLFFKRKLS